MDIEKIVKSPTPVEVVNKVNEVVDRVNVSGYVLPAATVSTIGGVKQGPNISIAADGTISADRELNDNITTTGSVQQNLNPSISASFASSQGISVLEQVKGISAGTYTLKTLLATLTSMSHSHNLVYRTGNNCACACDCNCDCSSDG